jgi:hypothetical protein
MKSQSRSPVNFLVPPSRYLDARTGYYREHVRRAFDDMCLEPFGRLTAEHSAQLTGQEDEEAFNKTERYELWFQDIPRAVARYPDWTAISPRYAFPMDVVSFWVSKMMPWTEVFHW